MANLSNAAFERLVLEAIESLPEQFRQYMDGVAVEIEGRPSRRAAQEVGRHPPRELLGLFEGVPLTDRSVMHNGTLPSRIIIYRDNIKRICRTPRQVVREVRKTVLHEIGHHFGLDEDELRELGY